MTHPSKTDPVWQAALSWVMAVHEAAPDARMHKELAAWLAADPAHRQAYAEASNLWLLTGLVPPATTRPDEPSTAAPQQEPPA